MRSYKTSQHRCQLRCKFASKNDNTEDKGEGKKMLGFLRTKRCLGYNKFLITVNYRSGISESFWATSFSVTYEDGELTSAKWGNMVAKKQPVFLNITAVESVYISDSRVGLLGDKNE